jgi:hypothetical protein
MQNNKLFITALFFVAIAGVVAFKFGLGPFKTAKPVATKQVEQTAQAQWGTTNKRARFSHSLGGDIVGVIPAGTRVSLVDSTSNAYQIRHNGLTSWVSKADISVKK